MPGNKEICLLCDEEIPKKFFKTSHVYCPRCYALPEKERVQIEKMKTEVYRERQHVEYWGLKSLKELGSCDKCGTYKSNAGLTFFADGRIECSKCNDSKTRIGRRNRYLG